MSVSNISGQWDVSQTSFNTAASLRALISTLSRDDVHPQALFAAEALGALFQASPVRIDEAITALNGNESTKISSLKAVIGLESGGIAREMRKSTPLLKFFLFITVARTCYSHVQLGNLMFQLVAVSGNLNEFPVSVGQLTQLINTIAGHSESLIPLDYMCEVATILGNLALPTTTISFDMQLHLEDVANIIQSVFQGFQDDEVCHMTLEGNSGIVWLSTLFLWMLPDQTNLFVNGVLAQGPSHCKLSIYHTVSGPWTFKTWKSESSLVALVEKSYDVNAPGEGFPFNHIPVKLARTITLQNISPLVHTSEAQLRLGTIGAVAGAVAQLLLSNGYLEYTPKYQHHQKGPSFSSILGEHHFNLSKNIMREYGWGNETILEQSVIFEKLKSDISRDHETILRPHRFYTFEKFARFISRYFKGGYSQNGPSQSSNTSSLIEMAIKLGLNAFCMIIFDFSARFHRWKPNSWLNAIDIEFLLDVLECPILLVGMPTSNAMNWKRFEAYVMGQIMPTPMNHPLNRSLAFVCNGIVAVRCSLWGFSTQQRDAMSWTFVKGTIHRDSIQYDAITEYSSQPPRVSANPVRSEDVDFDAPPTLNRAALSIKFDTLSTIVDNTLEVKFRLSTVANGPFRLVSLLHGLSTVLRSTHFYGSSIIDDSLQETVFAELKTHNLGITWINPFSHQVSQDSYHLIRTFDDERLQLFVASHCASLYEWGTEDRNLMGEVTFFHSGSLLECITKMKGRSWTIVC